MGREVFQSIAKGVNGAVVQGATVTVYLAGTTTLATAYESVAGAVLASSQTTTDSTTGKFEFWIDRGDYNPAQRFKFTIAKTSFITQTYDSVQILNDVWDSDSVPQTLTGAGAVSIVTKTTHVDTTGGAAALTLADGTEGQEKFIAMSVDAGAGTLAPTSLANGTTITFDDVGDSAHLLFTDSAWHWMGGTATLA